MKKLVVLVILFLGCFAFAEAYTQQPADTTKISRKTYQATRVTTVPDVDGEPFEAFWDDIPVANNFFQLQPKNGLPERDTHKSVVKIAYDNNAFYVAAYLYDNEPQRILKQFSQIDDIDAQADIFGFFVNTYNNQINQTRFYATSANGLADAVVENDREDFSYNVLFVSESSMDTNGWYVEMKIPYQTLRFPDTQVQDWSFQLYRRIRHLNEEYTYNLVDIATGNSTQYDALLTGISDIKPPLRLNLNPYASIITNQFNGTNNTIYNAGMDIKYGINDAFTLDATLIPDFGQVAFDQVELNLGPFEQTFSENRAFFTEGTDLFRKGDIFFSRRIGQQPSGFNRLGLLANERILENPSVAKLLNAVKVTGRTNSGLGIGFLNAITERTQATIVNDIDGTDRKVITEPLTNYNMLVVDQQFGQNSSIALVNASTLRNGAFTDAVVTATELTLNDKTGTNRYSSQFKMSNRFTPQGTVTGINIENVWRRTTGNWRPVLGHYHANKTWNANDLGVNFRNDFHTIQADLNYVQFQPQGIFNRYEVNYRTRHRRVASTGVHTETVFELNPFFFTRDRNAFGMTVNYTTESRNQFESRIPNLLPRYAPGTFASAFISTDYRKKLAVDLRGGYFFRYNEAERLYNFNFSPRYRFSDKFLLIYNLNWSKNDDRNSYVRLIDNRTTSLFASRDTHTVENNITGTYNFNNKQALSLSFRNFWSRADFSDDLLELQSDGTLVASNYDDSNNTSPDANFNVWNLDLSYRWRFAPASEAVLLYRNNIFNFDNQGSIAYQESLDNLFVQPINHNLSLRVIYFLDFNDAKKWFSSKQS